MKRLKRIVQTVLVAGFVMFGFVITAPAAPVGATSHCDYTALTFPTWHRGMTDNDCNVRFSKLSDLWKIVLNIGEILIQLVGYASVVFIVWGGLQFLISQGSPDKISSARNTILNASIGLVIAITAVAIVRFVAGLF